MQESNIDNLAGAEILSSLQITPTDSVSKKLLLGIIPLTPVPITGPDAWIGWLRIISYGSLAAMTHKRAKKISYGLMAATGISLVTSLAGEAYPQNQREI